MRFRRQCLWNAVNFLSSHPFGTHQPHKWIILSFLLRPYYKDFFDMHFHFFKIGEPTHYLPQLSHRGYYKKYRLKVGAILTFPLPFCLPVSFLSPQMHRHEAITEDKAKTCNKHLSAGKPLFPLRFTCLTVQKREIVYPWRLQRGNRGYMQNAMSIWHHRMASSTSPCDYVFFFVCPVWKFSYVCAPALGGFTTWLR